MNDLPRDPEYFRGHLYEIARNIARSIRVIGDTHAPVHQAEGGGDVTYPLDVDAETALLDYCGSWSTNIPFLLIAEGLPGGRRRFDREGEPEFTLIVDPIDGTRELMYGKRSAWTLLAVAPGGADETPTLADIEVALQLELPTPRAGYVDALWAIRGKGAAGETRDLRSGEVTPFELRPSGASSLEHGFASIVKYFPGAKRLAVDLEEAVIEALHLDADGPPLVFDDQYISTGGQMYELMVGHDRFIADLRGLPGQAGVLTCHPYDICTWLIAHEAGVRITDERGHPLATPLDTTSAVSWLGYANDDLQALIEPVMLPLIEERLTAAHGG